MCLQANYFRILTSLRSGFAHQLDVPLQGEKCVFPYMALTSVQWQGTNHNSSEVEEKWLYIFKQAGFAGIALPLTGASTIFHYYFFLGLTPKG